MNDDRCEDCWYYYGTGACHLAAFAEGQEQLEEFIRIEEASVPCGYFEPKDEPKETDEYDAFQKVWN